MAEKKKLMVDVEIIKGLMKEKGTDEKKLAELMKVTPQTVKRFFNTHIAKRTRNIFRISRKNRFELEK